MLRDFFPGTKHSPVPECANHAPGCQPAGDPLRRSGSSHDVIHFNATMASIDDGVFCLLLPKS